MHDRNLFIFSTSFFAGFCNEARSSMCPRSFKMDSALTPTCAIRIEVNQPAPIAYGPVVLRYVQPPGHTYQPKLPGRTTWRLL